MPSSIGTIALGIFCGCSSALVAAQDLQPPGSNSPVSTEVGVVNEAGVVLQELSTSSDQRIPDRLLAEAAGIAIVPHFTRGALVVGVSGGRGVLVTRDGQGNWQAPEFIKMGGGSVGWQVGVQSVDLVLVFRSQKSLDNIRQGKLTLGVDASAAAGPIGRYTSAATDTRFQAEILTYSRSRGLFAGVALGGSAIQPDRPATERYYQISVGSPGVVPPSAYALINELIRFSATSPVTTPSAATFPEGGTGIADPRVTSLQQSVGKLQSRLDQQWQQYLALPGEWLAGKPLTTAEVHAVLLRYERVVTNPQFAALRDLPEFQTVLEELRQLEQVLTASTRETVSLPPPPRP